jgi:hypothetical protein
MLSAIQRLELTSGLKLCLDASDINSYSGAGQSWLDTSGNGYDFFRGTTSAAQATDPTFNGVAGGQSSSEYWSFDGGDFFTYDTSNETWMNNLHKNSAIFSIIAWLRPASFSDDHVLFTTLGSTATDTGAMIYVGESAFPFLFIANGGSEVLLESSPTALTSGAWNFVGISLNEATGAAGIQWNANGTAATDTSTYTSPSASNASITANIGGLSGLGGIFPNGSRLAMLAMWEGVALTAQNLTDFYSLTKSKFGL